MDKSTICVVEAPNSSAYNKRYFVVDKETGAVLDDAQGYGYKTPQKAYAAYNYKHRDRTKDAQKAAKSKRIRQWMKENKSFIRMMDEIAFEMVKGSWGPDENFNAAFVKKLLSENDLNPDFTAGDLLKEWKRHNRCD